MPCPVAHWITGASAHTYQPDIRRGQSDRKIHNDFGIGQVDTGKLAHFVAPIIQRTRSLSNRFSKLRSHLPGELHTDPGTRDRCDSAQADEGLVASHHLAGLPARPVSIEERVAVGRVVETVTRTESMSAAAILLARLEDSDTAILREAEAAGFARGGCPDRHRVVEPDLPGADRLRYWASSLF